MKNRVDKFLYEKLSYAVRGCVFKVYNELGFGHKEKLYQNALEIEFDKKGLFLNAKRFCQFFIKVKKLAYTNLILLWMEK